MASAKTEYGTASTFTCTLASLASAAVRQSTVVDNSSDKFLDVLVQMVVKNHASSAPTGDKAVYIYAYATADDGTTYGDTATGTDGGITLDDPTQLKLIGVLRFTAAAQTKESDPMSVAAAYNGVLPKKWGIVVKNATGFALDTTEGSHKKLYQGVYASVT